MGALETEADSESLRGTGFWLLWFNAAVMGLVISADRFTFIWLVEDTLASPTWATGVVVFALGLPVFALVLTAGALVDRYDRRRMLLATQLVGAVVLAVVAVLVASGWVNLTVAVMLALTFGVVVAFALPVRPALVPALVAPGQLMRAVVLMSIALNIATIGGPLLVGAVIDARGVAWAFGVQAACLGAGVVSAWRLRVPPHPPVVHRERLRTDIASGLRYVWQHPQLRALFALLCVGGGVLGGGSYTLLPRLAREEFGRSAADAAGLFALLGAGMVVTSVILVRLRSRMHRRGRLFMWFFTAAAASEILQGLAPSFLTLQMLMVQWGLVGGMYMNLNQSLIQELTPLERMGRVMGLNTLVNTGLLPLGGLVAGVTASFVGVRATLVIFGCVAMACAAAAFVWARGLRALA